MDDGSGDGRDEQDDIKAAVLEFVRRWPSPYPSTARIAQAIGKPPGLVIEVLAQIRASGEYPDVGAGPPPEPVAPPLETWDRAN